MERCEVDPVESGWGMFIVAPDEKRRRLKETWVFASRAEAEAMAARLSASFARSHADQEARKIELERLSADAQRLNAEWIAKGARSVR
ncbi:MAG: hypothetical protein R2736_06390 [Solirubrobacterales bacterium]